ncbi:hypothetical protein SCANM124S_03315 [Streptomyces canus]
MGQSYANTYYLNPDFALTLIEWRANSYATRTNPG